MFEALLSKGGTVSALGAWAQYAAGPQGRQGGDATSANGKIYTFGGFAGGSDFPADFKSYTAESNLWETKAGGPPGRWNAQLTGVGTKVCLYGGQNNNGYVQDMRIYDTLTDTWAIKTPPSQRVHASNAAVGNKVYYYSGITSVQTAILNAYDVVADTWTDLLDGPGKRYKHAMAAVGTKIYMYGGANPSTGARMNDHWVYDTVANTWTQLANGPLARSDHTMVAIDTKVYVFGGSTEAAVTAELLCYDTVAGTWTTLTPAAFARADHGAAVANGKMFITGGYGSNYANINGCYGFTPA